MSFVDSGMEFYKIIGEFLIRQLCEHHLFVEVGSQVVVDVGDGIRDSLGKVIHSGNVVGPPPLAEA